MPTVEHSAEFSVPADVCFAYIDSADNVPKFVFGAKAFDYLVPTTPRLGAKFLLRMQLGPIKFALNGHVSEYAESQIIALSLDDGLITGTVVWGVTQIDAERCSTSAEIRYQVGGGLAGRALSKVIDSILEPGIKYTESKMREQVTAHYRALATD